ncbi:hypothetical protein [Streptomyces sp. NPDC088801]|uniref:hypothetical protein n=1 Tax=Streptomyces sp. NPDC088801 TaxID=3365903 RepID=UPI0038124199
MGNLWFEAQQCREDYAIVVGDGSELFQVVRVRRSATNDVYVNFLARPELMSHTSYHQSGQ